MHIPAKGGNRGLIHKELLLEDLLVNPFDMNIFMSFAALFKSDRGIFTSGCNTDVLCERYKDHIDSCRFFNHFTGSDGARIGFLAVRLKSAQYTGQSGIAQRCFISRFLTSAKTDAVIAAFYHESEPVWRLSFVRKVPDFFAGGIKLDYMRVKRSSYLAGDGVKHDSAQKRLLRLFHPNNTNPSLQEMEQVFSQTATAREFIKECKGKYPDELIIPQVLNSYGFSAQEGMPDDEVVSVDGHILGALFESLLEGKDRKRSGTFYTPLEIVQYMCFESISNYLVNKTGVPYSDLRMFMQYGEGLADEEKLPDTVLCKLGEIDNALANVKVLDPAAGSGAFPVCMLNEIVNTRMNITEILACKIPPENGQERAAYRKNRNSFVFKWNAIENSIYAADIDETAIRLTKLRLWLSLACECGLGIPAYSSFSCNAVCEDSLLGEIERPVRGCAGNPVWSFEGNQTKKECFDIVIGNPPYISAVEASRSDRGIREAISVKFPLLKGAFDTYAAFLLDGMEKTREDGVYCWIVPNKLLVSEYAKPVFRFLREHGLRNTVSISGIDAFAGTGVYPIIVSGNRNSNGNTYTEYIADSLPDLIYGRAHPKIKLRSYKTFADSGIRFASGATGFQAKLLSGCITECEIKDSIPFIVSGSVDKYSADYRNVRYMGKTYNQAFISKGDVVSEKKWDFWCGGKIIIAGLTKVIEAFFCNEPLALGVGVYAINCFAGFNPFFLLGVLNSKFLSWYLNIRFNEKHLAGGYLAVNKSTLEQLPLVAVDGATQSEIAEMAERIQKITADCKQRSSSGFVPGSDARRKQAPGSGNMPEDAVIKALMDRIDGLVYKLYDLNDSEIEEVENCFKL